MVGHRICFLLLSIFHLTYGSVETLHFESACLQQTNLIPLRLRCTQYEHIEIIRVIYGYSKQPSISQCQFSIYDCIQEGASRNILSCNGKQTCSINLTKNEILSTTVNTHGVPSCSDFNYVQVNFGCISDAKDICDSWKDEGSVVHLSHINSKDKQYNECQCKVRSSLKDGQVLLHAREIDRQFGSLKDLKPAKVFNTDCKKTTYLEIATDRSERKCMDNLPSNGNALFGSGSNNFTLTYIRNDPLAELFFYFELKASPVKKDHHVQIICNWARRTTTIRTTTLPPTRKRKLTTLSMLRGGRLSRLDLIRHPSAISETELTNIDVDENPIDIDETTTAVLNNEGEGEEDDENLTTNSILKPSKSKSKSKKKKINLSTTIVIEPSTTIASLVSDNDDEWSRILSIAGVESPSSSSKQLFPLNNHTFLNPVESSNLSNNQKSRHRISTNKVLIILLIIMSIITFILFLYCLKVKQCGFIRRFKINLNVAFLFCCEAGKLLFSSSNNPPSVSSTPQGTMKHHRSSSLPIADYQSSEYYMNDTGNNCHTTQSIYDGGGKSIYSVDDDYDNDGIQGSEYMTKYNRHHEVDTC